MNEFREKELVYDYYVDLDTSDETLETPQCERKRGRAAPSYRSWEWDEIDSDVAGKMRTEPLRKWAVKHDLAWMAPINELTGSFVPEEREDARRDNLPRVRVADWLNDARIAELTGTLLVNVNDVAASYPSAHCGLQGVPKAGKRKLRVIFDARPANDLIKPSGEQLVLFTLAMLVAALAMFRHVHTVDYRHYYYQILIPLRLMWYFVIMTDSASFLPRVLPMGYREAVTIAQCLTWAVVLYTEPGEPRLGVDFEALQQLCALPSFVSLYDAHGTEVGRIFVLLDGVCVACRDASLKELWTKRLRRNEDLFHVVRKETKDAMLDESNQEIEFAGFVFSESGWWSRADIQEPRAIGDNEPARALANRLGRVLWALRVRGALDPGRLGPVRYETLMQLYETLGTAAATSWSATVSLAPTQRRYLIRLENILRMHEPTPWNSVPRWPEPEEVCLLATDAFTRGLGFVLYRRDGSVETHEHLTIEESDQVDAEGRAIPWALRQVTRLRRRRIRACIVAVDADTIRNAINKGYARSARLRTTLVQIFDLCDWIVAVRVPGDFNAADKPSRGEPLVPRFVAKTWGILQAHASSLASGSLASA